MTVVDEGCSEEKIGFYEDIFQLLEQIIYTVEESQIFDVKYFFSYLLIYLKHCLFFPLF